MKANRLIYASLAVALMGTASCHNSDTDFADFDYTAVYFAYQSPVRTIVLGDDYFDNSADNAHRCQIQAVSGGTYDGISASVSYTVDPSLVEGKYFDEDHTMPIKVLDPSLYTIEQSEFVYSKSQKAVVDVQLKDEFFNDDDAVKNTYVIPLKMNSSSLNGADKVLADKDYVLYCVKFINKYHASYLRRGEDKVVNSDGNNFTLLRSKGVENDEVIKLTSTSLHSVVMDVKILNAEGNQISDSDGKGVSCKLELTFNESDELTKMEALTPGFTVESAKGSFKRNSEILAFGNKDRNAIYLEYTLKVGDYTRISTSDVLVCQTRGIAGEWFTIY